MVDLYFSHDDRLGIHVPSLNKDWHEYHPKTQHSILLLWESIRGRIPDRIASLEKEINKKLDELSDENDFNLSCKLNHEIADLASIINDLWIWYRTSEDANDNKLDH